jgi:hypothetical protein
MSDNFLNALSAAALLLTLAFLGTGGCMVAFDCNAPRLPTSEPAPIYSVGDTLVIERSGVREIKPIHDNIQNKYK